ncbi:MAG: hypothetical protein ACYDC1_20160 [Limisphaerales bacterium]
MNPSEPNGDALLRWYVDSHGHRIQVEVRRRCPGVRGRQGFLVCRPVGSGPPRELVIHQTSLSSG